MELLSYMVRNAGTVLHKDRIIQAVWDGAFVGDDVLTRAIALLRKALGDDAKDPRYIQIVPRRGYVLIADVSDAETAGPRYQIVKRLGRGAMGEVFLADDTLLHRRVALKFVLEEKQTDASYRKRLLREARAAAALDHPFICKTYTVGQLEGRDFIAMEYVDGRTLRDPRERTCPRLGSRQFSH